MATTSVVLLFTLMCALHEVSLRSIDQIFEELEAENLEKSNSEAGGRTVSSEWYDYTMKGRTEELVKLQFDLVMTKGHWDKVIDTDTALPTRNKRNAVNEKVRLWPRRIPYVINEEFDIEDKLQLILAMNHWEEYTCLEFVEAKSDDSDYIEFVPESNCESLLGRMQGRQPIHLAPVCMHKAVIVHEIGHALGLYHEHMRADRDKFVTVHFENIDQKFHNQFDTLKREHYNNYNKPYDYESIMHYGKLYYSLNRTGNLLTIEPKNASYLDVIGETSSLSFYDVNIVSDMYQCSRGCKPKVCQGNGFQGKNCDCYCTGKNSYDIVLCDEPENCGKPDIAISDYYVYTEENQEEEIQEWDIDASYTHGTKFMVEHRNQSCGGTIATFNCTDGQWEGEVPPCEQACIVENYSNKYRVKNTATLEKAKPGESVSSYGQLAVLCKNRKVYDDFDWEYITCFDGNWSKQISDIECKERALCTMVLNAQLQGTFEEGFTVTCSHGHELETPGGPGNKFTCSWEGNWEPADPVCNPAKCKIPARDNAKFYLTNKELFSGSDVTHGSDVTLKCDRRYIPVENAIRCSYGEWQVAGGIFPSCEIASCLTPKNVANGKLYDQNGDEFNDPDVLHGNDVTLKCDKGHVPDDIVINCKHRKWQTKDEEFPKCTLVECPVPTIVDTKGYEPKKEKYIYGDIVKVGVCKGALYLEGSRRLECLKTGNWSNSAVCQQFCSHGEDFEMMKNKAFKNIRHKYLGLSSYSACKRACQNYKRFLCLSFEYGVENWKHYCRLYRWSAYNIPSYLEDEPYWTIGVRTCASRKT